MLEGQPEPGVADWLQVRGRQALMNSTAKFNWTYDEEESGLEALQDGTWGDIYQLEFRQHKRDYYCHKLGYQPVTAEVLQEQTQRYIRAIQWKLHYY